MKKSSTIKIDLSNRKRFVYKLFACFFLLLTTTVVLVDSATARPLQLMKTGLGNGTITSSPVGINCGITCKFADAGFSDLTTVTLKAVAGGDSIFVGWREGDPKVLKSKNISCWDKTKPCTLSMSEMQRVRPIFDIKQVIKKITDFTPKGIKKYLKDNSHVNNAAEFVKALPDEFKQNWILMSRSESLQTGTAKYPRILLPSADAWFVFSIGTAIHASYPGSHPLAVEYMQWDADQLNFRFHEIVLDKIDPMDPDKDGVGVIPTRPRGFKTDDVKCSKCHSTRNVLNIDRSVSPPVAKTDLGTDGIIPGTIKVKNKPNWDAYDSWTGMLPFNRDKLYQGSVETAAFRKIFNPWTWVKQPFVRSIIEQLQLQPSTINSTDSITRTIGGPNDGHINFAFDNNKLVTKEPLPTSSGTGSEKKIDTNYSFDGKISPVKTVSPSPVIRGGSFVVLRHTAIPTQAQGEGRGVRFFDTLGGLVNGGTDKDGNTIGNLNSQRIADEVVNHKFATGSHAIDVRPIAMAIANDCLAVNPKKELIASTKSATVLNIYNSFFTSRNGMNFKALIADTGSRANIPKKTNATRAFTLTRRKADLQRFNLDRTTDVYRDPLKIPLNGLIQEYGGHTKSSTKADLKTFRQEIFRRPKVVPIEKKDRTVMNGIYIDREEAGNIEKAALYRYFLEPLGVSVDQWSMGVRARSMTYAFADVFQPYHNELIRQLNISLKDKPVTGISDPKNCSQLIAVVNKQFSDPAKSVASKLPKANAFPKYTDIQRIFNKACIECHGGLDYPPYSNYGSKFDLSENESPAKAEKRLDRAYLKASKKAVSLTSPLYDKITRTDEKCPGGVMPCNGPPLSKTDKETIRRWIVGGRTRSYGDPHITTVEGINYDFQSAGEFVLLRGQGLEVQARHTPLGTLQPLDPDKYTGLTSCMAVNTALAIKIDGQKVTYQPNLNGKPDRNGLQLRVDGKLVKLDKKGIALKNGGRIIQTSAKTAIQIESAGGTAIVITAGWWKYFKLWYLTVDMRQVRVSEGIMGAIAPGNWLPALPDGSLLGPMPKDPHQRYLDLYDRFANAWRVTKTSTLFDYAAGTSTDTFTVANWPVESPKTCDIPLKPGDDSETEPPPEPLPAEEAEQYCNGLVDLVLRDNCIQDVRVTAEPAFAETYLVTEKLALNETPEAPELISPVDFGDAVELPVTFTWNKTSDINDDTITYKYCLWHVHEESDNNKQCEVSYVQESISDAGINTIWLTVLIISLLLVLVLFAMNKKPAAIILLIIVVLLVIIFGNDFNNNDNESAPKILSKTVTDLKSGEAYMWKVIAEDDQGGWVESNTWYFEVK